MLVPVTVYHLIWRGFRQPAYLQRWGERYGVYRTPATDPGAVGACGLGRRSERAAPLVDALLARHPRERLLVTTITPTGSARVRALSWGERVDHVYLPYDLPGAVSRFLRHFRPRIGLVLETELWPNLLFGCRDHGVPAIIVNGRLSERSLQGLRPAEALLGRALRSLRGIVAQSAADAARFLRLGASPKTTVVGGNLKFDIAADPQAQSFARAFRAAETRARRGSRPAPTPARRPRCSRCTGACASAGRDCCCCGRRGIRSASAGRVRGRAGGIPHRDAADDPPARRGRRRVRGRYAGRTRAFLRLRGRGLRRRQPRGHRRAQPARARGRRHRDGHRPAPAQFRRHRRAARGRRARCASAPTKPRWAMRWKPCSRMRTRARRWPRRRSDCSKAAAARCSARWTTSTRWRRPRRQRSDRARVTGWLRPPAYRR